MRHIIGIVCVTGVLGGCVTASPPVAEDTGRIEALERRVAELEGELAMMRIGLTDSPMANSHADPALLRLFERGPQPVVFGAEPVFIIGDEIARDKVADWELSLLRLPHERGDVEAARDERYLFREMVGDQ